MSVVGQTTCSVDHSSVGDLLLEHMPTPVQRKAANVAAVNVQAIERHEHRRRTWLAGFRVAEQMKLRDELFVKDANLAIEDQCRCFQRGDRSGELSKPLSVVDGVTTDEANHATILVSDHSPAVVLLFVNPARPVKRLGLDRRHRGHNRRRLRRHRARLSNVRQRGWLLAPAPWHCPVISRTNGCCHWSGRRYLATRRRIPPLGGAGRLPTERDAPRPVAPPARRVDADRR